MNNVIDNQLPFVLFMLLNLLVGWHMSHKLLRSKVCNPIGAMIGVAYNDKEALSSAVLNALLFLLKIVTHLAAIIYLSSYWRRYCGKDLFILSYY